VEEALLKPDKQLVAAHRGVILDPRDPQVKEAARANGVTEQWLEAAEKSPVYALVKEFGVALPLHPEFRTMPMAYYIPSLSPVLATIDNLHAVAEHGSIPQWEKLRAPVGFLASLLSGGNREIIEEVLKKLIALRGFMRSRNLGQGETPELLREAGLDEAGADRLYRLFTIGSYRERNIIPGQQREEQESHRRKGEAGFGILKKTGRGK
jgi:nitrate reductase beta subunit